MRTPLQGSSKFSSLGDKQLSEHSDPFVLCEEKEVHH